MNKTKRITLNTTTLVVLAVLFVAVIMLSNTLFRGVRVDLTENQLYTVSDGTRRVLEDIDEPINLYFFFSDRASKDLPFLRTYANRVRELLEELTQYANGDLVLHVIDPAPFSEEEDRAAQLGLQSIPVGAAGDNIFFGLAGTNSTDGLETIAFFQPDKEAFLEYDLSKLIYNLAHPKKPVIGLITTLPMASGFDPMTRQMREPWVAYTQMQQLFEVRDLGTEVNAVAQDVDVLMVVHPKNLPEQTLYAIDQFVLGGGKAMVFVDPNAEADTAGQDPSNPAAAFMAERASNLPKLFESWGIEMPAESVIGDARYALEVSTGRGSRPVRHLAILSIDRSGLNQEDVVTAELNGLNFATAGYIKGRDGATTTLLPLVSTSTAAMPLDVSRARFAPDPSVLEEGFAPTGERYHLAVRVQGTVKSAFPDGPPGEAGETSDDGGENPGATDGKSDGKTQHISESTAPINVIVVADTDVLSDRLWVQIQNFFGQRIASAWANNGDFLNNGLDNLTGSNDLIGIRGQATSTRPFTTVDALNVKAEEKFRATEQQLQQQLQETEHKLNELQAHRDDTANPLILSAEQRDELERFQQEKLNIRKQLRQVQHDLDKDIEGLGTTLKVINIALVPLLVSAIAIAVAVLRRRRRHTA
jgi:ABC-type uncharacterized transport system involved in gliding motility auxiliary subunit